MFLSVNTQMLWLVEMPQGILTARLAATGDAPTGHDREEGHTAAAVRLSSAANEPLKTHIDILREAGGA